MCRLNQKGFTLVELLAVITILGLLMGVAVGAVSWVLGMAEERFYESLEKDLVLAGESYYADHRGSLPATIGQSRKLSLKTLVDSNYIAEDKVVDYGKAACNLESSYIEVTRVSKSDHSYSLYLKCPAKTIDTTE